jgi:hypothetical protein
VDNGQARLVSGSASPTGTVFFDELNPYDRVIEFEAEFDFRIGTTPGQVNEGLSFAMLSQTEFSNWSSDTDYGEALAEVLDTDAEMTLNFNTSNANDIIIRRSGSFAPRTVSPSFDLDNAQWHHAKITWADFVLTVVLTPSGGSPEVVFSEQIGSPFRLSPSIFAFGAGRANTGQTGNTWIDNVRITDLSNDDDCDGDGLPDGCDTLGCVTPINDECSGAIAVGWGDYAFDISDATGSAIGSCSSTDPQDIWFSFTPGYSGPVRIETVEVPKGNGLLFYPTLGLYDGCGGTELACAVNNTPGSADEQARIDTTVTEGVPVLIRVAGWLNGRGPGILRIASLEDSDGDGVADACDACPGFDDNLDSDGDGIPDACDPCDDNIDCDGNLISDCEDAAHPGRFEDFSGAGQRAYTLNGNQNAAPGVSDGSLVLTRLASSEQASVVFEPVTDEPVGSFTASFDLRITPNGPGADGVSFVVLDTAIYGSDAQWGENGPSAGGSLAISFDTYLNEGEPGDNFVEIRHNNAVIAQYVPTFWLEYGQWFNADITFDGAALTLVLTTSAGAAETAFDAVPIPGFTPFVSAYGFGARTGGVYSEHRVDNVRFIDTSHGNDDDGDGVSNACDICPGFDDTIDLDGNGTPDGCELPEPCLADLTADGILDLSDINAFVTAFTSQDLFVDLDQNGILDLTDISLFIASFTAGCP